MMHGIGGVVAVAVTALLVCCSADPHQEQDGAVGGHRSRYDGNGQKARNLDPLGGGNLIREVRATGGLSMVPIPIQYVLDRRVFVPSLVKRNFDEIDHTTMPFPYSKRFFRGYGSRDLDAPIEFMRSSYDKKRLSQGDFPMDEIDLSHFPIGSKRSFDSNIDFFDRFRSSGAGKKRFDYAMDEIDASHFPIGYRR